MQCSDLIQAVLAHSGAESSIYNCFMRAFRVSRLEGRDMCVDGGGGTPDARGRAGERAREENSPAQ